MFFLRQLIIFFLLASSFVIAGPKRSKGKVTTPGQSASRVQKPQRVKKPPLRTQFQQAPSANLLRQKIIFPNLKPVARKFSGTYYRRQTSTSAVLQYYANDVIDIFIDGSIIVSALPDQPGGPPVQNAFLWEEMRQRLAGEWVLMPSALTQIGRRWDHLTFATYDDGKRLRVFPFRLEVAMLAGEPPATGLVEDPPPLNCNCEGLWRRMPTTDAYEKYADDVAEIFPKSGVVDIHKLSDKPGLFEAGYGRLKRYERSRLIGLWRRLQSAKLEINHRNDLLTVSYDEDRKLRYVVSRQEVETLGNISPKPFPWTGDIDIDPLPQSQDFRLPTAAMPVPVVEQ